MREDCALLFQCNCKNKWTVCKIKKITIAFWVFYCFIWLPSQPRQIYWMSPMVLCCCANMKRIGYYIKIVLHNKNLPRAESQHKKGYSVNQMFWYYISEKAFWGWEVEEGKKGHSWYICIKLDRKNKQIISLLKKKCPPSTICSVFYFLEECFDLGHRMYCRFFSQSCWAALVLFAVLPEPSLCYCSLS